MGDTQSERDKKADAIRKNARIEERKGNKKAAAKLFSDAELMSDTGSIPK